MNNRRKVIDRRAFDQKQDRAFPCNRRYRPCRRLNNISMETIPADTLSRHPVLLNLFRKAECKAT